MAGTSNVSFTMQELENPVSVAGYNVTSSLVENHECNKDRNIFCYLCGQFEVQKYPRFNTNVNREIFLECFDVEILPEGTTWTSQIMCGTCLHILNRWKKFKCDTSKRDKIKKFSTPTG